MRTDVDILVGIGDARERAVQLFAAPSLARDDLLDEFLRRAEIRLLERRIAVDGRKFFGHGVNIAVLGTERARRGAVFTRGKHAHPVARKARRLTDDAHRADLAEIVLFGKFLLRVALAGDEDVFIAAARAFDGGKRDAAPHIERDRGIGEYDLRPHGDDGQDRNTFFHKSDLLSGECGRDRPLYLYITRRGHIQSSARKIFPEKARSPRKSGGSVP